MPPEQNNAPAGQSGPKPDKEGYYRLGRTTLSFLLFKYGFPVVILFVAELVILGALAGGNVLPPFSEWVSASPAAAAVFKLLAALVPGLIVVAIVIAAILAFGWYWSFRYSIRENDLSFEKGIIGIQEISVPFRQIQNVDIEQSVLYRVFNIADLLILTAGHEDPQEAGKGESEIVMPALSAPEARRLQRYLLDRANVQHVIEVAPSTEPPVPPPLN